MTYLSPVGTRYVPPPETESSNTAADAAERPQASVDEPVGQETSPGAPPQATEAAVNKLVAAQHAVQSANTTIRDPHSSKASTSQASAQLPALQKQLATAQQGLITAVNNEMNAEAGQDATHARFAQAGQQIEARFAHDPASAALVKSAVASVTTTHDQTQAIIAAARAQSNPVKAIQTLSGGYTHASASVKSELLQDPAAKQLIAHAAQWATPSPPAAADTPERINNEFMSGQLSLDGNGYTATGDAYANQSMQRLAQLTQGVDPNIGAQVVNSALPGLQHYGSQFPGAAHLLSYQAGENLMQVASNVQGTAAGTAAVNGLAGLGAHFFNPAAVTKAIGDGASPAYAVALAKQPGLVPKQQVLQSALQGVQQFQAKVDADVGNYAQHMQGLNWLIEGPGKSMPQQQLTNAINAYKQAQGPDWNNETQQDLQQVTQDGAQLLTQLAALHGAGDKQIDSQINQIMSDPSANSAMSVAIQNDPALTKDTPPGSTVQNTSGQSEDGGPKSVLDFFSTMDLSEKGSDLAKQFATQYVRNNIIPDMAQLDSKDPASYARAIDDLNGLKNSPVLKLLGVQDKQIPSVINALKVTMPKPGENWSLQTQEARLKALKTNLEKNGIAESSETGAGQVLMGIGLAASVAGLYNNVQDLRSDPDIENLTGTLLSAAGVAQQSSALALAKNLVSEDSTLGKLGGDTKVLGLTADNALGLAGGVFDVATGIHQLFGKDADPVAGGFSIASGVGGLLATDAVGDILGGAWAGPVGIGIGIAATVGESIYDHEKDVTQYETPGTTAFLHGAGFSSQAASALTQQSDNGYSPVPLLERYAQMKGLNLQNAADWKKFTGWVNEMSPDQLSAVVTAANGAQDTYGGDPSKFKATSSQDNVPFQQDVSGPETRFVQAQTTDFHAESEYLMGKLLQYIGAPQLA